MSHQETYCESCGTHANQPGLKAPPGWYRCPVCEVAKPRHRMPRRTVNSSLAGLGGGPLPYFVLWGDAALEQA